MPFSFIIQCEKKLFPDCWIIQLLNVVFVKHSYCEKTFFPDYWIIQLLDVVFVKHS